MTLEDFEKALAEEKTPKPSRHWVEGGREEKTESREKHHRHHQRHHRNSKIDNHNEHSRRHRHRHDGESKGHGEEESYGKRSRSHGEKRPRDDEDSTPRRRRRRSQDTEGRRSATPTNDAKNDRGDSESGLRRDAWMEAPPATEVTYVQRQSKKPSDRAVGIQWQAQEVEHNPMASKQEEADTRKNDEDSSRVDYVFGDPGARWRMTKLRAVYTQADDTGRSVEEIAMERYGSLREFDNAREEQTELERRQTYGDGYVGKERPSGELYQERKLQEGVQASKRRKIDEYEAPEHVFEETISSDAPTVTAVQLDQTALNKLKAQMMKAKLKGSPDFAQLEAEYTAAMARVANRKESDVVVLGPMESRMLAGRRRDKETTGDAGEEKKKKKKDDDGEGMSIEQMVREERMTKGQAGEKDDDLRNGSLRMENSL